MREPITKELRELVDVNNDKQFFVACNKPNLLEIADRIDMAHKSRLDDCRHNTKRALVRYLRGVLTDYDRGIKRVRKGDAAEVVRCKDCQYAREMADRHVCTVRPLLTHFVDGDDYCSRAARVEDESPTSDATKRYGGCPGAIVTDEVCTDE